MWVQKPLTLIICAPIIICVGQFMLPLPPVDVPMPCDTNEFTNLDKCCRTPQFFPKSTLLHCIELMGTVDANETLPDFQEFGGGYALPKESFSGTGGAMLIIECMFKNYSLLSSNQTINVYKVMEIFQEASNSTWSPVVKNAVETCTFDEMHSNMTGILENTFAVLGPTYFMSCIRRFLSLNCPKSIMEQADASCVETIQAVSKCHPFSLEVGTEGGSRGWIGSLLRWLIGPQSFVAQKETSRIIFPQYP